jgi:signal transduction histidine kinase/DNA-binding response OmpR family regulator
MREEIVKTGKGFCLNAGGELRISRAERDLEDLVQLLSDVCQSPFAAISLKGGKGQWFKAQVGNGSYAEGMPDLPVMHQSAGGQELLIIEDVSRNLLSPGFPVETLNPIRFYAGILLVAASGEVAGTLWIADSKPRKLSGNQAFAFRTLGRQAMNVLALCLEKEQQEIARHEQEKFLAERVAFLKAYSQELRAPLNNIMGMAYWLIQDQPRPEHLELINTLRFTTENLMGLINDTLDYHQLQAGKLVLEPGKFCIPATIKQLGESVKFMADLKGIAFKIDAPESLPVLVGDSARLSQVLTNLLSNAVKFTEQGSVKLKVEKTQETEELLSVKFQVTDTGRGMPGEKIKTIYTGFKKASPQINSKHGGTGLGLAITQHLLQLMDSSLKIESKAGEGTCLAFVLTFKKTSGQCPENIEPMPVQEPDNYLEEKKILLVEDNKVNQLVISKFLQKWGFKTRLAGNGKEAVELAGEQTYDLILMDLQMPGMDGNTAASHIRSLNLHYSRIPILALTATGGGELDTEPRKAVFNALILKPFKPEKLYNTIYKNLYAARPEAEVNPLQEKVEEITQGDIAFKKQLVQLYLQSFREILADLDAGRLQEPGYLRHLRHKHKATFKMLGLATLENAMLSMQERLNEAIKEPVNRLPVTALKAEINQQINTAIGQLESIV